MIIDNEYLEDEVRDGFYIPSIAKRAWAAELSVLNEINRICKKYSITYYADWGSLLGAVRHQGFIPWDDDLDICMHRNDLNRFMQVAEKELPEGFKVISFENNDYSWKFIVNVVNTERMCFTPEYLKTHYNFPYMATIDIFVIDNVYDDECLEQERRDLVKYILSVSDVITEENIGEDNTQRHLRSVESKCGIKLECGTSFLETKRHLYRAVKDIIAKANNTDTESIIQQIPWGIYNKMKYPRDYYDSVVKLPFENTTIYVPKRYDMLLKKKYGRYWEVRMGVGGHGYPYYKAQRDALGLKEDEDYIPHYRFDRSLISIADGKPCIGGLDGRENTVQAIDEYKNSPDYDGQFDRETVLFLPFKGQYWACMKPFYEEECSKENTDVFVVPLTYYYKEYNGVMAGEAQYDLRTYPEELPVYLVDQLDIESMFPDRIYIQNPYDEYNICMSVPTQFYASNIRNLTKRLIYVPWFRTADFDSNNYPQNYNMRYYCTVPGVVLSDEVIVHTEIIRERYIDKLCEFAGDDTREIWEEKIKVCGSKDLGDAKGLASETCGVKDNSDEGGEAQKKKVLLFYTSPSTILEYGEADIDKIKHCLDIFNSSSDKLSVIWHFDRVDFEIIKDNDENTYNLIKEILNTYLNDVITLDTDKSGSELANACAAYYGDPSHIAKDFWVAGKPVMISNPEYI